MAEQTLTDVMNTIHHLSSEEFEQLMELLEQEEEARSHQNATYDPLIANLGAWADLGDEAIDELNALIERERRQPPREIVFDWDEDEEEK
jgi:hypothetical protein